MNLEWILFLGLTLGFLLVAGRMLKGQRTLERAEWTLEAGKGLAGRTLGELTDRLAEAGYRIVARTVRDSGETGGGVERDRPLDGLAVRLADPRLRPEHGEVLLRVSHDGSFALLEATDRRGGAWDELASFAIAALADLSPGLTYKLSESKLQADEGASLREVLPRRARGLTPG